MNGEMLDPLSIFSHHKRRMSHWVDSLRYILRERRGWALYLNGTEPTLPSREIDWVPAEDDQVKGHMRLLRFWNAGRCFADFYLPATQFAERIVERKPHKAATRSVIEYLGQF